MYFGRLLLSECLPMRGLKQHQDVMFRKFTWSALLTSKMRFWCATSPAKEGPGIFIFNRTHLFGWNLAWKSASTFFQVMKVYVWLKLCTRWLQMPTLICRVSFWSYKFVQSFCLPGSRKGHSSYEDSSEQKQPALPFLSTKPVSATVASHNWSHLFRSKLGVP